MRLCWPVAVSALFVVLMAACSLGPTESAPPPSRDPAVERKMGEFEKRVEASERRAREAEALAATANATAEEKAHAAEARQRADEMKAMGDRLDALAKKADADHERANKLEAELREKSSNPTNWTPTGLLALATLAAQTFLAKRQSRRSKADLDAGLAWFDEQPEDSRILASGVAVKMGSGEVVGVREPSTKRKAA